MRYYETLYIINPNYEQERLGKIIEEVGGELSRRDGLTIVNHRIWGKKRLAYPIQKHKYGTYILLQFETKDVAVLGEFDTFLKLNRGIIRHQVVRLDNRPEVIEDENLQELLEDEESGGKTDTVEKEDNDSQPTETEESEITEDSKDMDESNEEKPSKDDEPDEEKKEQE